MFAAVLLIVQTTILAVMLAGFIVVHYGPEWLHQRISNFYRSNVVKHLPRAQP